MSFVSRFSWFLIPSIIQGGLQFLILPVMTLYLNPKDYGAFAFLGSITGLGAMAATASSSFLLSQYYHVIDKREKQHMISTLLLIGFFIVFVYGAGIWFCWPQIVKKWEVFQSIPKLGVFLSLFAMIFNVPWIIAQFTMTLDKKASRYAFFAISASITMAVSQLVSVSVFKLGMLSLFIGLASTAMIQNIGGMLTLRQFIRFKIRMKWLKELGKLGVLATINNLIENLQVILERHLLSIHSGLNQLGLFTHSQQYRTIVQMGVGASTKSLFPVTLDESRDLNSKFENTRTVQEIIHLCLTMGGIFFATFGKYLISLITNDKFTEAYVFVPFWMIYLLILNSGKAEGATILSRGYGKLWSKIGMIAGISAIAITLILIPLIGVYGAILAAVSLQLIYRVFLRYYGLKQRSIPFQDYLVITGIVQVIITLGVSHFIIESLMENLGLFILNFGIICFLGKKYFSNLKDALFQKR